MDGTSPNENLISNSDARVCAAESHHFVFNVSLEIIIINKKENFSYGQVQALGPRAECVMNVF